MIGSRLAWVLIGVVLVAVLIGSYALLAENAIMPTVFKKSALEPTIVGAGSKDLTLILSLDKTSYQAGSVSTVTIAVKNTGNQRVIIETQDQIAMQLTIYDGNMNTIGIWGVPFHKPPIMYPQTSGTIALGPGETYSWVFKWDLGVHATTGTVQYQNLPAGSYNAQSRIAINFPVSGTEQPDMGGAVLTSNIVQFSVT